ELSSDARSPSPESASILTSVPYVGDQQQREHPGQRPCVGSVDAEARWLGRAAVAQNAVEFDEILESARHRMTSTGCSTTSTSGLLVWSTCCRPRVTQPVTAVVGTPDM